MLDARVWWPLFPLLLLLVIICLTWALVVVMRRGELGQGKARWLQGTAFACYFLAALSAIASERGLVSAHVHRPFSLLTQLCLLFALIHHWKRGARPLVWLNALAWAGILADASLHVLMVRH